MANIIKKIKRKHKKKKLQAEYAKMEQSRQNRTPEDAYQERLSKHRNAAIRRAMMTVVAVAVRSGSSCDTLFLLHGKEKLP